MTLAGDEPSTAERLLAERVVICWYHSQADLLLAQVMETQPPDRWGPCERRQDRCVRRYMRALKTMEQVRRLRVPRVQVNVAEQQVNIS